MKKYIAVLLAAVCLLAFAGCAPAEETRTLAEKETGITLSVKNVSPTGLTLVCTHKGALDKGEIITGSYYVVEKRVNEKWVACEYAAEGDIAWTMEAWLIPLNDTTEWNVDWSYLYGELAPGKYRIGKEITVVYDEENNDTREMYAEFEID